VTSDGVVGDRKMPSRRSALPGGRTKTMPSWGSAFPGGRGYWKKSGWDAGLAHFPGLKAGGK